MKTRQIISSAAAFALVLVCASGALSAKEPAAAAAKEAPSRLSALVGKWKGSGQLNAGGEKATGQFSITCEDTAAGTAVLCRINASGLGPGPFLETDLFGIEPDAQTVHLFAVNNAGDVHDHAGHFTDDKTFSLTWSGSSNGAPLTEKVTFHFEDARRLNVTSVTTAGDQQVASLDIRVTR